MKSEDFMNIRKLLILLFLSIPAWGQITDYNVPRSGVGLTVCIGPGSNNFSGSLVKYAGSCLGPFALNATTFGYLDSGTGNLLTNTTGVPVSACPIFEADTNQFLVTAVRDKRPSMCSGATGVTSLVSPDQSHWYLVPQSVGCGTKTNCTPIFGDTKVVIDATSNSTTTVTCPSNDCNFTAADVGKTFWATTQGTGTAGTYNNTTFVCPLTTIASVNSAQSVTLNLACTASGTGNVVLIYGHRDGTTLHGLDGNNVGCVTIVPFDGAAMMIDQAIFISPPSCVSAGLQTVVGYPQKDWIPVGNSTVLVMTPDFNYTTCLGGPSTNVCIGAGINELDNTAIWGTGLTNAANSNCSTNAGGHIILELNITNAAMKNTNVSGVCPGTNGTGVLLATTDEYWSGGGSQYSMTKPCEILGNTVYTYVLDCRADSLSGVFGMTIDGGATATDLSTFPIIGLSVLPNGTFQSRGTHYGSGGTGVDCVNVSSGGTFYSYGDYMGIDFATTGSCLDINGQVQLANTKIAGTSGGVRAIGMGTGTLISLGGNTITAGPISWFTGWAASGPDVLQGSCTGTVASASTIGLFNLGNNTTTTCTSTTTNIGPVMGKAGTIFGFGCQSGTAGNQSADACTVLKNNSATSLTCSLNGVTTCGDGAVAHQTTFAAGDIITVKVVSGTSTTLANVKASVIAW